MRKLLKRLNSIFSFFFPPLKFKRDYFKPRLKPTAEDLDKWAEDFERKHDQARRRKRGN